MSSASNDQTIEEEVAVVNPVSTTLSKEQNPKDNDDFIGIITEMQDKEEEENDSEEVVLEDNKSKSSNKEEEEEEEEEEGSEIEKDDVNSTNNPNSSSYVGKKPKWWKALARRKGTKGQRKAISYMTQRGYVLPRLDKYLHVIDIQKMVSILPRGLPLTNDILIPQSSTCNSSSSSSDCNSNHPNDDGGGEEEVETKIEPEMKSKSERELVIHLEIGFGQGENLLTNAMLNQDQFYIGAEIHQPGVGVALTRMKNSLVNDDDDDDNTSNANRYWMGQNWWGGEDQSQQISSKYNTKIVGRIDKEREGQEKDSSPSLPYDNLRICPGDGVKILRFLPSSSIDNIYLTFPDPWPKKSNSQYRVIQEDTLELIRQVLKPGGHFYLATDAVIFDEWTTKIFDMVTKKSMEEEGAVHWKEMEVCPNRKNWLPAMSKYELKGIEEGRYTICRCWEKSSVHV